MEICPSAWATSNVGARRFRTARSASEERLHARLYSSRVVVCTLVSNIKLTTTPEARDTGSSIPSLSADPYSEIPSLAVALGQQDDVFRSGLVRPSSSGCRLLAPAAIHPSSKVINGRARSSLGDPRLLVIASKEAWLAGVVLVQRGNSFEMSKLRAFARSVASFEVVFAISHWSTDCYDSAASRRPQCRRGSGAFQIWGVWLARRRHRLSLGYATAAGESESGQSNEMAAERTRSPSLPSDAHFRLFRTSLKCEPPERGFVQE